MINGHMKTCSTLLIIREVHIKTTMKYYLTLVRMATIKKRKNLQIINAGEKGTLLHCWWNVDWWRNYEKQCVGSLKNRN